MYSHSLDMICLFSRYVGFSRYGETLRPIKIEALCAPFPEALAHSPSQKPLSCPVAPPNRQMPLRCPVAPPSQHELHKDNGGGGGGVARRARAARAPKAKSCTTSSVTSSKTSCAASFTCPPFTSRPPLPLGLQHQQQVLNVKRALDATTDAAA